MVRSCLFASILLAWLAVPAVAAEIIVNPGNSTAVLGTSYHSTRESFGGFGCIKGSSTPTGAARSSFNLDQTIGERQLARELGFTVGARARYGVVEGSLAAEFLSRSISNAYSIALIYRATYTMPVEKLVTAETNEVGRRVENNPERWNKACGDRFVSEIIKSANLFVSIRVDFSSQRKKDEFATKFSISGPLASANASLSTASASFDSKSKVTVSAYQVGGDVSKLTGILGNSQQGVAAYTECTLGNFESCSKFITNVLTYASDTMSGFPSQLAPGAQPGPAVVAYGVSSYEDLGIFPEFNPILERAVILARDDLSKVFESNYRAAVTTRRLLEGNLHPSRRSSVERAKVAADKDIREILPVASTCYETPEECPSSVNALELEDVDPNTLLPTSFLTYCLDAAKGPQNEFYYQMSTLLGAAHGEPGRGYYVTEENCRKADAVLMSRISLTYHGFPLTDLSILGDQTQLQHLNVSGVSGTRGRLQDISVLADFKELRELQIAYNEIEDLSPLRGLKKLEIVNVRNNRLEDLEPLRGAKYIFELDIRGNHIGDLEPISNLSSLFILRAYSNPIQDVTPLIKNPSLRYVDLTATLASYDSVMKLARERPGIDFLVSTPNETEKYGSVDEFIEKWYTK